MARIDLGKADLSLIRDPFGFHVVIPHLIAVEQDRSYDGTLVRFDGDEFPTAFVGEGQSRSWAMTARYASYEQDQLRDLMNLVDLANKGADSRILLRSHYWQSAGLNEAQAVSILGVKPSPQIGVYADASFTANAVQWDPAV